MESNYVKLMEARKKALRKGDEETAEKLMKAIRTLARSGTVTEDEFVAGAYI
jgi:triphosphoribosyl-dephospho-CoA synthetase